MTNSNTPSLLSIETLATLAQEEKEHDAKEQVAAVLSDPRGEIETKIKEQEKYAELVRNDEEYQERRKDFLNKLSGLKRKSLNPREQDEQERIQKEFLQLPPEFRYDKEIIQKLFQMQYQIYDGRGNYQGVGTYKYDYNYNIVRKLPDILYHDKEFILSLAETLGSKYVIRSIENKYGTGFALWKDKDFVKRVFALENTESGSPITLKVLEEVVKDDDIIETYYTHIGGYNWHKQPEKYRENPRFILAALKHKGLGLNGFYTLEERFNRENPHYYDNLKKHIQELLTGDKPKIINIIETDVLSIKGTDIEPYMAEINQDLFKDPSFVCKLLRFDEKLVKYCGDLGKKILRFITKTKQGGSFASINRDSISYGSEDTIAYIQGTSRDSGAGMEYGNYVKVIYNGQEKHIHEIYRDGHDPKKDDWNLLYNNTTIDSIKTEGDKVIVTVTAISKRDKNYMKNYTFAFDKKNKDERPTLNETEQKEFLELVEKTKQKIIDEEPFRSDKNSWVSINPSFKSQKINAEKGVAIVVLYKQVDHSAVPSVGNQYAYEAFKINKDGSYNRVDYKAARDDARRRGDNIVIDAQDYAI